MPALSSRSAYELNLSLCARLELRRLPWGQPRSRQPRQTEHDPCRMCSKRAHACAYVGLDSALPAPARTLDSISLRARCERERRLEQRLSVLR